MDSETEEKIQETVVKILMNSDTMDKLTKYIIRKSSPKVRILTLPRPKSPGMKLSQPMYKDIIRQVVETYLTEHQQWNTAKEIEEAVVKYMRGSDIIDKVTDYIIRKSASPVNLGVGAGMMNLSAPGYKVVVRQVVETYLTGQKSSSGEEEKQIGEDSNKKKRKGKQVEGEISLAKLSRTRKVSISEFGGKPFVSISQYSHLGGKDIPTTNGVSLTCEEWEACSQFVTATDYAIRKMEGRLSKFDELFRKQQK